MAIISNAVTIADAGAFSVGLGSMVLIKTLTLSNAATASFVDGASSVVLDDTYPVYRFVFTNIHPITDAAALRVGFRDGGTAYDATKTTTAFSSQADEADSSTEVTYQAGNDLAQSTAFQDLCRNTGNGNDECVSGELILFSPSSTTFVKNFIARSNTYFANNQTEVLQVAGYCNVTAAIDGVQFKMDSGNIDSGTIKLYGISS